MLNNANTESSILIIYTGGTIGMVENPKTGVLEPFDFGYLNHNIPELQHIGCNITIEQFTPPIDSSAIKPDLWAKVALMIQENYDRYDGFVVLHGTDTMAYTASALSFMLKYLTKPVILTGSQLPISKLRTDGKENLITAIEIAAATINGHPRVPEVCIFFENHLMRGNRTSKISADQFNAFESYNYPKLAYAGIDIKYNDSVIRYPANWNKSLEVKPNMDANVAILKIFPGITREVVEAILSIPTLKGVVLETFGSGNAFMDEWFLNALSNAVKRGVVIINVTQCVTGYVDMMRYETGHQLMNTGLLSGYDTTTECALVKLMYLLGQGYSNEKVKQLMEQSLRGEINR
ncbi:1-alkyl-2-acetylglycerophosphocholine esterase [Porphyromonas macacae]|nr:asparaginase [Porphyromonas macacae]KGN74398.1 1-alkyl-2-acetylglycerophosphocholine esterase [Porphyromonas macacae]KGN99456.1 1-alkyl-2-acetylglycerophosphocholine esterase [Porphyromonas macacae]